MINDKQETMPVEQHNHRARPYWDGRFVVPCVRARLETMELRDTVRWWPIIGRWHEDKQTIGFRWWHFHIDWRMVNEQTRMVAQEMLRIGAGAIAKVIVADDIVPEGTEHWNGMTIGTNQALPEHPDTWFRYEARTMSEGLRWPKTRWIRELESRYSDARLTGDNAMRCPHKGADLEGIQTDADGTVECPLHGLRWCTRTGQMRPRTE